ncbi:MAG: rod shape-determining protein MreD [candidate division NC10 bacterium]|nr:rod shape-determining protein MreD [candidate division NC10 bacterium]
MKAAYLLLAILALIGFQTEVLPYLSIGGIKPDLFLFAVCYLCLRRVGQRGALIGFSLGLLGDSLSLSPLGMKALSFSLIGYLLDIARRDLFLDRLLAQSSLLFLAGLLSGLVSLLSLNFFLIPRPLGKTFLRLILPESLLTALLGLVFIFVVQSWGQLKARQYGVG